MSALPSHLSKLSGKNWFCFAAILAAGFLTIILPTLLVGLHASGDTFVYLNFAQEIKDALAAGHWFPGWADDNAGFGSVGIRFYPPIAIYSLALISRLTGEFYWALTLMFFMWTVVGCWGMYLCVRELATPLHGLIAGLIYTLVPFHLAEIFRYSLIAEFVAGAILPYCLWLIIRIYRNDTWRSSFALAIAAAAVVLAHIPTTIIAVISFGVLVLAMARHTARRTLGKLAVAGFGCILLTAFYWMRVVPEVGWVAHSESQYAMGMSSPAANLFPMTPSVDPAMEYALPVYRNIDAIVLLTLLFFVPSLCAALFRPARSPRYRWGQAVLISSAVGFLMLSKASTWIWQASPLIYRIQFPWRWLGILSVFAVISLVWFAADTRDLSKRLRLPMIAFLIVLGILVLAYDFRQSFNRPNTVTRADLSEMLTYRDRQTGTTLQAWWPASARPEALQDTRRVDAAGREVDIREWSRAERSFIVGAGEPVNLRVGVFYYPLWQATSNGEPIDLQIAKDGTIMLPVGSPETEVQLSFKEPSRAKIGVGISLASFVGIMLMTLLSIMTKRETDTNIML